MLVQNISSPVKTQNSDVDISVILDSTTWRRVTRLLSALRIGQQVRTPAYRVEIKALNLEAFILDRDNLDLVSLALIENHRIMLLWTQTELERYAQEKAKIAHLTGEDRKAAKARLALDFGLWPGPYLKSSSYLVK